MHDISLLVARLLPGVRCLITGDVGHKNDVNQLLAHVAMAGGQA
jgi:hypothetical protein